MNRFYSLYSSRIDNKHIIIIALWNNSQSVIVLVSSCDKRVVVDEKGKEGVGNENTVFAKSVEPPIQLHERWR